MIVIHGTSQWLRIHLPGQGTWVQSLVQEDSIFLGEGLEPVLCKTSHRNEQPVHHSWRVAPIHCN